MNEVAAKTVVEAILDRLDLLCSSASVVRENSDSEYFDEYQLKIATIVAEVGDTILEPIFEQYPQFRK